MACRRIADSRISSLGTHEHWRSLVELDGGGFGCRIHGRGITASAPPVEGGETGGNAEKDPVEIWNTHSQHVLQNCRVEKVRERGERLPLESAKDNTSDDLAAAFSDAVQSSVIEDGQGDKTRKPEEHGQGVHGEVGDFGVGADGEKAGAEGEEGESGEEGPNAIEEHEVDLGGRVCVEDDYGDDWCERVSRGSW